MPKMKGYIAMGMIGLTAIYFAFVYALKDSVSTTRFMGGRNELLLPQCTAY
jgi:hypothetical protein